MSRQYRVWSWSGSSTVPKIGLASSTSWTAGHTVTVKITDGSQVMVDGLQVGDEVIVPASDDAAEPTDSGTEGNQ